MSNGHPRSFWRRLVAEIEKGGSAHDVARRHGVKHRTLVWWRWRFRSESAERGSRPTLLPVLVRQEPETARHGLEVVVGDIVVRVPPGVDPGYVAALVGALRQC